MDTFKIRDTKKPFIFLLNNMQAASVQQRSEQVQLTFACMKKKAQGHERSQPLNPLVDETHLTLLVS
jgi:hypothetical protein